MSEILQIGNIHPNGENQQQARVYDTQGLCPTLRAGETQGRYLIKTNSNMKEKTAKLPEELRGKKFRIRKLTPRECGRLQDVDDSDIDKIESTGLSNSAMYKLYGNSITVNVLFHLFRKMFIEQENENQQLRLF